MKLKTFVSLIALAMLSSSLLAQVYPLSESSWSNPDFVKRFLGSYGTLTNKEPQITTDEAELFQEIGRLMNANDSQGAIVALRNAATAEASAAIDYTLGNVLLQGGDYDAGIKAYETAIRKFPNFLRAYKNSGLAYLQLQNYEKGAEFLVKSIELGNQEGDNFGLLGYCYLNMGMNDAALDAYRLAGVMSPKNKDWQVGKATALQRMGLNEEALAKFDELIMKYPNTKAFYTAAANASISLQKELQAARYLELLRRNKKADASVLMLLGDIYLNQKLYGLATDVYAEALPKAGRKDGDRFVRFTRGLVAQGVYDYASDFLNTIDASTYSLADEQKQKLLNLRSQIALASGDSKAAVASLEKVIEADPLNGEALILLGEFYYDSEDFETALFYFERAQKIEKHQVNGFIQAARVKVSQSQFIEAINLLQQAQAIKKQAHIENYLDAVRNALKASS